MTQSKFKRLTIGDTVTTSTILQVYGCGYPTGDGRAFVKAGIDGVIGAVNVPAVTVNRRFHCVDFPPETEILDSRGNKIQWENRANNCFRVAAYPEELV